MARRHHTNPIRKFELNVRQDVSAILAKCDRWGLDPTDLEDLKYCENSDWYSWPSLKAAYARLYEKCTANQV